MDWMKLYETRIEARVEGYHPVVLGVLSACAAYRWLPTPCEERWSQVLASTIDSAAIAAGFLGTTVGILYSIAGTSRGKWLADIGVIDGVVRYLKRALYMSLALVVATWVLLAGFVASSNEVRCAWYGMLVSSFFGVLRVARLFFRALHSKGG